MAYSLADWFVDAIDKRRCMACKGFELERMGEFDFQCYCCGRWASGGELGRYHGELMHLSTIHLNREKQRQSGSQKRAGHWQKSGGGPRVESHASMKFIEELSSAPEAPGDPGEWLTG